MAKPQTSASRNFSTQQKCLLHVVNFPDQIFDDKYPRSQTIILYTLYMYNVEHFSNHANWSTVAANCRFTQDQYMYCILWKKFLF